ncbi:MAG: histidinol dehydrogenase [Deltaproteobacteria bacterium]|nr:histidinol dehydrogenase [Candidatus Zymogenaceae bacterium]
MINLVSTTDPGCAALVKKISARGETVPPEIEETVRQIIRDVRTRGDEALIEYTERYDSVRLSPDRLEISKDKIAEAASLLSPKDRDTITAAAARIETYHKHQSLDSFTFLDEHSNRLGQIIRPLARVGVYVPGGRAPYPSTLLMNVIPARVAGVHEIIAVHPVSFGSPNPAVMAAAGIAGVDRIFGVGGAQAVAALAFGTETIPKVDKIVGPGNIYVATAKKMLMGVVDIDMIAGPSEIVIIADGSADPAYIAADLLSQAEHDPLAASILIVTDQSLAQLVTEELDRQIGDLSRSEIARASLNDFGAIIVSRNLNESVEIANDIAPEHLELLVADPVKLVSKIENAGAIFLGTQSPETVGDYAAGPNHVLPTGGTARFSSPLSVYDFLKRISIIEMSREGLDIIGRTAHDFAMIEGLDAHAKSVGIRLKK